jgi:hypothetical protein
MFSLDVILGMDGFSFMGRRLFRPVSNGIRRLPASGA